ncbi:hypothetical protein OsJ_07089 [Oryza sativa Japonica Group]|uniref:Uncharacterized protein n=1 Tax=Oryza sativa subsp. japonica TaxID=39947 RepID=A3A7V5_ORYSJ|nr:hypothetical protein OsJ_07089 [Oryza sativa Japonica Group]
MDPVISPLPARADPPLATTGGADPAASPTVTTTIGGRGLTQFPASAAAATAKLPRMASRATSCSSCSGRGACLPNIYVASTSILEVEAVDKHYQQQKQDVSSRKQRKKIWIHIGMSRQTSIPALHNCIALRRWYF